MNSQTHKHRSKRRTALERSVRKLLGVLNRFYFCEISPLILVQLQITSICSVRIEVLYLICETSEWNTYMYDITMMKPSKWLNGDLKPENKKTINRASIGSSTDIDSQTPTIWNRLRGSRHLVWTDPPSSNISGEPSYQPQVVDGICIKIYWIGPNGSSYFPSFSSVRTVKFTFDVHTKNRCHGLYLRQDRTAPPTALLHHANQHNT